MFPEHLAELEKLEAKYRDKPGGNIVFFGSSSIRLWPGLWRAFPDVVIENWGFGGSNLSDCAESYARFIAPRRPRALVIYAGDNDLARGASPSDIWEALAALLNGCGDELPTAILSLKLSPSRAELRGQIEQANEWCERETWARENVQWVDIVAPMSDANGEPRGELFVQDGLHLSRAGYDVWNEVLAREVNWL